MRKLHIAIDCDGTLISENYPRMGVLINGAKEKINKWYKQGHVIMLNTCRSGLYERRVVNFLNRNSVKFTTINQHTEEQKQAYEVEARKLGADVYIDNLNALDRASRVDWEKLDGHIQKLSMEKKLIIAIVGDSGSGKTTVAEFIEKEYGVHMIPSHTDRAKRYPKETGHTFHTAERFSKFKLEDMIAFTNFGDYRYCCLKSDVTRENTYVINESGLDMLPREDYDVVSIRVFATEKKRREWGVSQERISRDQGQFSWFHPFMLRFSKFDYCVRNSGSMEDLKDKTREVMLCILTGRA